MPQRICNQPLPSDHLEGMRKEWAAKVEAIILRMILGAALETVVVECDEETLFPARERLWSRLRRREWKLAEEIDMTLAKAYGECLIVRSPPPQETW